jgi:8-oxo-dGTP pyrophosphatase MutT (NUDIX family)
MKTAACVIIRMGEKFLAVSRRNDDSQWGFPGGKVDPGETTEQAAVREVGEEMGLQLDPEFLIPIFCDLCVGKKDGKNFWVTTFLYTKNEFSIEDVSLIEEGLHGGALSAEELQKVEFSPFAEYNAGAFSALQKFNGGI